MGVIDLTRELIRIDSVSQNTSRPIADFVSNFLDSSGFKVVQSVYNTEVEKDGKKIPVEKVNVMAVKGGSGVPELAYSGHMDTVGFDPKEWRTNPLDFVQAGKNFFGRGACDMKSFIAMAMLVGEKLEVSSIKKPFGIILTSDEEVGCVGAKNLTKEKKKDPMAKFVVIGEPTRLVPYYAHKGYIFLRITLLGEPGHSSYPSKGLNTVTVALPEIIKRINEFTNALKTELDDRFDPPYSTLNVGVVKTPADAQKNKIAHKIELELDIRPLPGTDVDDIIEAFKDHIGDKQEYRNVKISVQRARFPTPPFYTNPSSRLNRELERLFPLSLDLEKEFADREKTAAFNTEGGLFNRSGCECVICGPGNIDQAHKANEFIAGSEISDKVLDSYLELARTFCC